MIGFKSPFSIGQIVTNNEITKAFKVGNMGGMRRSKATESLVIISDHNTKWNAATVKRILQNEKYKGDALLQKTYTVDYLTKKTKVNEGEIPQYYVEGGHEAIIDPDVFDQVQIELEKRCPGRNRHSGVHDFSGKIKCG